MYRLVIAEIKGIQHGYMLSRRVDALAWKGNTLVVEPLVTALNSIVLHSTDQAEKICAIAKTLGRIGDSRAVDPLLSLLQFEDLPGHHGPAAQVHNAAIWALGEIGDEKAIESLIAVFKSDSCDRKTIIEALTKIGVSQDIKQILMSTIISDPIEDKAYNISCLELLGWTPKTEEEQIDYYLEKEDVSGLRKIGRPAIDRMINLFRQIPHIPASESLSYSGSFGSRILVCLGEMDDKAAQDVLITQLKGKGRFCKIARDVLNRGKSYEEEHCLCPKCFTYMGVRNHLRSKGTQVSDQMRQEARQNKMVIIGDSYSRCPGCGERILV
jgi:hypothetical protein